MSEVIKAPSKAVMSEFSKADAEFTKAMDADVVAKESLQIRMTHTIKSGKHLMKAKAKCKHGEWEALLEGVNLSRKEGGDDRFGLSKPHVAKLMKIAKFPAQARIACQNDEQFSINRTYKALSGASEEAEKEAKAKPHIVNSSGNDEWFTPQDIIEAARLTMGGIDLDPASNATANQTVRATEYYSQDDDGLSKDWTGRLWMNPPYSSKLVPMFCKKLADSVSSGAVTDAVVIVNNATETRWFADLVSVCSAICFTSRRVKFVKPDGAVAGSPNQGQAIIYCGDEPDVFAENFQDVGWTVTL